MHYNADFGEPMLNLDRQNVYRAQYGRQRPGWQPATSVYERMIREQLRPDSRVLDLGCGRGGVLEQLGSAVDRPVGIDPDLESLREHRITSLPRAQAAADELPFADQTIDLVVCSWVLEHLTTPDRVASEVSRILKPGGAWIVLTPNARAIVTWINRTLKPVQHQLVARLYGRAETDTFPIQYRANTPRALGELADRSGLKLDTLYQIEDPTYLAFHPVLYALSVRLARITPPVHLVAVMRKYSDSEIR